MSDDLPRYWLKLKEPEAGTYELVTLAGWHPEGQEGKVFYIVKSLNGYLNEAFCWSDEVGKTWGIDYDYREPEDQEEPANAGYCNTCHRKVSEGYHNGCLNAHCPHGFEPCL